MQATARSGCRAWSSATRVLNASTSSGSRRYAPLTTSLGVAATVYALLQYFVRARERALADLAREHRLLEREQAKSERLLLNVLPEPVAARLKKEDGVIADAFAGVTVLFADIVGFTPLSERLSAADVVALLDRVFAGWDALAAKNESLRWERLRDVMPGYRYGVHDKLALTPVPAPRPAVDEV